MKRNKSIKELNNISLSEYLLNFLQFYANFRTNQKEIVIRDKGEIRDKNEESNQHFVLYSPIDDEDIGNRAFRIKDVFYIFKNRYNYMMNCSY